MQQLTPNGQRALQDIAQRYGLSTDAVSAMFAAVRLGGGSMAQFSVPELGGSGQWMQGGMTMVGDMFNTGLQSRVANLCSELSGLLQQPGIFAEVAPGASAGGGFGGFNGPWWPGFLGQPSSSGGQNGNMYAVFPQQRRLAISQQGQLSLYDTADHSIGGVQQQSGAYQPLSFSSQYGTFEVSSLTQLDALTGAPFAAAPPPAPAYNAPEPAPLAGNAPQAQSFGPVSSEAIFRSLEQLAELLQKGVLTQQEFDGKKAELLARL
jgi:hypothetical protein